MSVVSTETLDDCRALTTRALLAGLQRLDPPTRLVCGYQLGYWDADGAPSNAGGKGLRPRLALLSAMAADAPPEAGVPAAVACELVHNFSLLHDDVMDRDTTRRHRPTAWAVFGIPAAILAGDAMLGLAIELLAEAPSVTTGWAVRALSAATRRLIAGQVADLDFEYRDDVSLDECIAMSRNKTAALLECSASLGAVLVDAPAELALGLAELGAHLGLAFQLADDLLGLWGTPERTGKPVGSDLRSRKKSLPVVAALRSGNPAAAELDELYRGADALTEEKVLRAGALVEAAGGRAWAEVRADAELDAAQSVINALGLRPAVSHELCVLVRGLRGRDS